MGFELVVVLAVFTSIVIVEVVTLYVNDIAVFIVFIFVNVIAFSMTEYIVVVVVDIVSWPFRLFVRRNQRYCRLFSYYGGGWRCCHRTHSCLGLISLYFHHCRRCG